MDVRPKKRTEERPRALLTGRECAGPPGVAGRAVPSCVEGRQGDQVRRVAGQVGEVDARVRDKDHLDLLRLVLLVPLPVVDLEGSTRVNGNMSVPGLLGSISR